MADIAQTTTTTTTTTTATTTMPTSSSASASPFAPPSAPPTVCGKLPPKRVTLIRKRKISPEALVAAAVAVPEAGAVDAWARTDDDDDDDDGVASDAKRTRILPVYHGCLRNLIPEDWRNALRDEGVLDAPLMDALERQYYTETVETSHVVFPDRADIFAALQLCPLAKVRVVILGQDPYMFAGQAMGLAFSVRRGTRVPPSLQNVYKELRAEYGGDFAVPDHGDLSHWATQGVLLLNSILTVREKEPASHANWGWQEFTDALIALVCKRHDKVVFLLWGAYAGNKAAHIQGHYKLKTSHPSPKAADNGFFGCGHFVECNALLARHNVAPIEWGTRRNGAALPRAEHKQESISDFVRVLRRPFVPSAPASHAVAATTTMLGAVAQ